MCFRGRDERSNRVRSEWRRWRGGKVAKAYPKWLRQAGATCIGPKMGSRMAVSFGKIMLPKVHVYKKCHRNTFYIVGSWLFFLEIGDGFVIVSITVLTHFYGRKLHRIYHSRLLCSILITCTVLLFPPPQ